VVIAVPAARKTVNQFASVKANAPATGPLRVAQVIAAPVQQTVTPSATARVNAHVRARRPQRFRKKPPAAGDAQAAVTEQSDCRFTVN